MSFVKGRERVPFKSTESDKGKLNSKNKESKMGIEIRVLLHFQGWRGTNPTKILWTSFDLSV